MNISEISQNQFDHSQFKQKSPPKKFESKLLASLLAVWKPVAGSLKASSWQFESK